MLVIPAVDLRDGACVQLVGGEYDAERVRLDDPLGVAREWARFGFRRLHVVDLDAATGRGSNAHVVEEIVRYGNFDDVQVGGGVRDEDAVERILGLGARSVVIGTRGLEDPDWLAEVAARWPGQIVLAADVRERRVVTRGWARTLPRNVIDVVEELDGVPLAALLVTAVHREGQMQGTDLPLMEDVAEAASVPVIASGGVSNLQDLRLLADRGVWGAVVGMALYTGAIDPRAVIDEFGDDDA
jgi:phosphoribosylformimino-5-aminoimidazole carboxamide ribotide isomerase